ncbi:MAG: response regulator transcription factor [Candidatus Hadarchaeota archaeon]
MAKIIAVDDEPDIVKLIEKILKKAGHKVKGYNSGQEFLEEYSKEKPDLLMLDVMMPGMDGWEVYKRVRKINKKQKVLFITAVTMESESRKTMDELGVSDYMTKPFEPQELVERVKAVLSSR